MSATPPPRTSVAAALSLLFGLLTVPLLALAGVPALFLGVVGLRAINASDGRLQGRRLAAAGIVLGLVSIAFTALGLIAIVLLHLWGKSNVAECQNNLRQIGMAVGRYYDSNNQQFPPGTVLNPALSPDRRLSWFAGILPYLGGEGRGSEKWQKLAGTLDRHAAWDAPANAAAASTRVPPFVCPTQLRSNPTPPPGLTSYVGLAGIDPDAAELPKTSPRAGFFGYDRVISKADVTAGTSYTMTTTETGRDNGHWVAGGPATVRGLGPDETHYAGVGRPFGGLHNGGFNVLWADASVRFVRDDISPRAFREQVTLIRPGER